MGWHARFAGSPAVVVIALLSTPACGDGTPTSPTGPSAAAALSERLETDHFVFAFAPGDHVDAAFEEAYHAWATATLGVAPTQRVNYDKYRSRAHMQAVIGVGNTNAWADGPTQTAHTIWPTDNHEVVHLYTYGWGMPVALLSEGIAVAHQTAPVTGDLVPKWSGTPLHALARQLKAAGRLPPIAQMATTDGFRGLDPNVAYPVAGSFVRYLIDTRGLGPLRPLFGRLSATSPAATVRQEMEGAYGTSLDDLERDWLAFLDGQ